MTTASDDDAYLIVRQTLDLGELVAAHPPRFTDKNKKLVHALCCPPGEASRGTLVYERWRSMPLPERVPERVPDLTMREDVFAYEPAPPGVVEWHLNFADPHLFVAYAGRLLAQDELQVLEHPALGSLREWLSASADRDLRFRPVTEEDGASTPVLVRGVPRRCALATDPDLLEGRPLGLYGNRFSRASADAVRRAVTVIDPPTSSNILAMAAPPGGTGPYTDIEIRAILATAYTGFRAARLSSQAAETPAVVVHTGHWGTGAFGGNKVLMTILQMLAARLAGIDRLVHHTFDEVGSAAWVEGKRRLDELGVVRARIADVVSAVHAMGFVWGVSDGN